MTTKYPTADDINAVPGLRARVFRFMLNLQQYLWDGLRTTPSPETANFEAAVACFLQFRAWAVTAGASPADAFAEFDKLRDAGAFELREDERDPRDVAKFYALLEASRSPIARPTIN
jgi:hypothetical protein